MAPTKQQPQSPSAYFRRVHPFWMAVVMILEAYCTWAIFLPETIPYDYLGLLGSFTKYLVENHKTLFDVGYGIAWLLHVVEAFYAIKLCKEKGITDGSTQFWWSVQTFVFGFASLFQLLVYKLPRKET